MNLNKRTTTTRRRRKRRSKKEGDEEKEVEAAVKPGEIAGVVQVAGGSAKAAKLVEAVRFLNIKTENIKTEK
jgi:hypothetical protein